METIKISLAKPMYSLSDLDINWGECEEKDGVLKLVLNNAGAVSIFPDDTILFRRSGTIESQYNFDSNGDGTVPIKDRVKEIIVEQEVRVISANDKEFTVEAPKKSIVLCKSCKWVSGTTYYAISVESAHTIFYQDVEMAQEKANPIKAILGEEQNYFVFATNNELSTVGIVSSYTKTQQAIGESCGGNEIVPYDYYFIPNRESRNIFLCACDKEVPEGTVISFNQNDFYFTDNNGSCIPWTDDRFSPNGMPQTEIGVFKRTNYWNVPIGFVQNTDYIHLYQEERNNTLFAEKIKKSVIPPVINMERVKYTPIIRDEKEISIVCGITFNLHFRERDDNWNIVKNRNWCTCNPTAIKDKNFEKSDSLYHLGFTDNDVQYQKMKIKKSFIRLSFYSSDDPLSQSLLYYSTIFLDSGYLFGQFNKKRTELIGEGKIWSPNEAPKYVLSAASENNSDIRIDSQITIHNEFDATKSSEGFNLYLFADDCEIVDDDKDFRTIYMKVEFNHAGYGKTIPFMPWPELGTDSGVTIEEYFKNVYIPVKICHINKAYYYYFGLDDFGEDNPYIKCNKDNKSITFNLFEPKLKKES